MVSKGRAASDVRAAYQAGQVAFGESYVQEALPKQRLLSDCHIEWHFIGRLQSNKTRAVATHFDWVHSVDCLRIAERLSQQRPSDAAPLNLCLQVDLCDEGQKGGVSPDALLTLAQEVNALDSVVLRGMMLIPRQALGGHALQQIFREAHRLWLELKRVVPTADTLSMGMSNDYVQAIAAGSTLVRVGRAVFEPPAGCDVR